VSELNTCVQRFGVGIKGVGFRAWDLELGLRVWGLGSGMLGLGFRVQGSG